jgi:hypothetical protein
MISLSRNTILDGSSSLSLNFEFFSAESLWARLKQKNVQKVDSIVLWIQMNFSAKSLSHCEEFF